MVIHLFAFVFTRTLINIILGYLIYNDVSNSPTIISRIGGMDVLLKLTWFKTIFIVAPYFIYSIIKCLLTPH